MIQPPDASSVSQLIRAALLEDAAHDDRTSQYLQLGDDEVRAAVVAAAPGVIAGLDVAKAVFRSVEHSIKFGGDVSDGDRVAKGDLILAVAGTATAILAAERVALNFLQRLSGIATVTAQYVGAVAGSAIRILDTRKTTPTFRDLERYAVRVGGGHNHRFNQSDMILIKENHIRAAGGAAVTIERIRNAGARDIPLEIEVDSVDLVRQVLGLPVDRIMLDNFPPGEVHLATTWVRDFAAANPQFQPEIEVSGGINLDTVRSYIIEGVDFISVGALTHSAPALDMSLEVASHEP